MNKIYVVTAVDVGDTCDGRARVLGAFKNEADAKKYVEDDIHAHELIGCQCDYDQMSAESSDGTCLWNIEAVEVK